MSEPTVWLAVIFAALIAVLAIYYAVAPLLQPGPAAQLVEDDKLVELLGRKDSALQAIKDLEFDYRVGKISQEDYQRLDQRLRRQAIILMQQIDKLAPASASLDQELEGMIAHYRQTSPVPAPLASVPPPATPPIPGPAPAATDGARYCTHCGKPLEPGHRFCAFCGTPVAQADPAEQI